MLPEPTEIILKALKDAGYEANYIKTYSGAIPPGSTEINIVSKTQVYVELIVDKKKDSDKKICSQAVDMLGLSKEQIEKLKQKILNF